VADNLVVGGQLGSYLIDSVIGRGGMSVVYGAKHARLSMPVALKVLTPELSSDDTFRERFLREAQTAASLDHPNVIPIHDMGLHEDSLYIVMRYVAGGDLKALLSADGPLDPAQALRILTPIGLALDAAHAHGLVHRDVKPANILVQRSAAGSIEHVYLTDFGIAKDAAFLGAGLTGTGASIGTVGYMAPEQMEGREVSAQTDEYALAVTLYECLAGRIPFQRELAEGARPPHGPLEPLTQVRPDLRGGLDDVLAKALARDPADRYGSCKEFLQASESAAIGGVTATTPSTPAPTPQDLHASPIPASEVTPEVAPASARASGNGHVGMRRKLWPAAAVVLVLAAAAVVAIVLASGSSKPRGKLSQAPLAEVPTNHVTGSGEAMVRLDGDRAAVTITTNGLDNGAELVHLMHIHAGGKGECPPASAARRHNGHLAISTSDGINYYGPPVQALTTRGDTSVASILAFHRFPSGGALHYTRTIVLPPSVAAAIRRDDAVVVVHGTDYDGTGIYSGVLDASELSKSVPATATAPALCGQLLAAQNASSGLYTASLNLTTVLAGDAFVCHVPSAGALAEAGERRKRAA
jgi:serine/threonine protein kinase